MAQVVIMPKQGQSVESCIVSEFKKKVGDSVKVGDVLFGYETDKATFEEESQVEGTVLAIFYKDGDEIPCLSNVMVIGEPGESFAEFAPSSETHATLGTVRGGTVSAANGGVERSETVSEGSSPSAAAIPGAPASPRARKLADEKGVNLDAVAGSGPGGRIIERDVLAAAAAQGRLSGLAKAKMAEGGLIPGEGSGLAKAKMAEGGLIPGEGSGLAGTVKAGDLKVWKPNHTDIPGEGTEFETVKMSNMRKLIAKSMYNSLQNTAQLTHMLGADARKLQALRKKAKKALEEGKVDANITINDFVCFAVIKALQKFPEVNSHCLGDAMRIFKTVNLGCAVDTERGLMVPCVKNSENLSISELSKALKKLADDCKKGSINPDLLASEAASFTVSNLGGFGVEWFTPIINVPQSAILGVGTMTLRPKMEDGKVEFVPYLGLSLTYDHRAIDGGQATRFLKAVATEIENLEIDL